MLKKKSGNPDHPLIERLMSCQELRSLAPALKGKLCPETCVSKEEIKEMAKVMDSLESARREFLRNKILLNAIHELILDYDLESMDSAVPAVSTTEEDELMKELKEALFTNEIINDLRVMTGDGNEILGLPLLLDEDSISLKNYSPRLKEFLANKLEELLFARCSKLVVQLESRRRRNPESSAADVSEMYSKIKKLPEMVWNEMEILRVHKNVDLKQRYKKQDDQLLKDNFEILKKITKLRTEDKAQTNLARINYLTAKFSTLCMKIRCVELEILSLTYTPESVRALKVIHKHLKNSLKATKENIEQMRSDLKKYEAVGPEFESVVSEFEQVKADIEGKKWALQELAKSS